VPAKSADRFRGRKSYPTQNVLAVVDFDLHFTYVLAGWEGSAHDSLVLQDALSCPNGLKIPGILWVLKLVAFWPCFRWQTYGCTD